jgi:hypothetical protein
LSDGDDVKVLVACEYSGVVRRAFEARGHYAYSCDLEPSDDDSPYHYQGDVRHVLYTADGWDLMIAHPPCTHLAVSGARWFKEKPEKAELQREALDFVRLLMDAPIDKICVENPISVISSQIRKPDQIVQPWMFGHEASKSTCLWLKNLPLLVPTKIVGKGEFVVTKGGNRIPKWYNLPPSPDRGKLRSRTFEGIGEAMAEQWG